MSDTALTKKALVAAWQADFLCEACEIKRYEQRPITSQLTNNIKRFPLMTNKIMEKVNSAMTEKNRL